jgi:hypothetical protein
MARFCDKCGTRLNDSSAFCPSCGAAVTSPAAPAAVPYQDVPQPSAPAHTTTAQPAYVPQTKVVETAPPAKGGSALKILLIILVVLALGAVAVVGGIVYVGHRVVTKIENKAAEVGLSTSPSSNTTDTFQGDPCRFLTKAEVSKAVGVTILETKSDGNTCDYLAKGTAANMTSKHLSAIMGKNGADKATQDKIERFAEGIFGTQQKNAEAADPSSPGETTVLAISFNENSTQAEMKLDSKVLGALGPASCSAHLQGIGDDAFVAANGMMLVRKGSTLIRMMYISCPCNTDQIKPLAKKLAAAF